jgi:hypothetical protein
MKTKMNDATAVGVVVEIAKSEILADVRSGRVPATVASFAALHDHVDANCYGGAEESWAEGDSAVDEMVAFWNAVQNELDAWIKAGGIVIEPSFCAMCQKNNCTCLS